MSKIALSGNASGTGTLTFAAPNTNTDRTLDLPDAAGTIQVSGNPISGTTGSFSGDLSFNSGYGSAAVAYGCRAWVNVKGDDTPPTVRGSGNVSSVTRGSTGVFTVNFTNAMPDVNYATNSSSNFNNTNCASFPGTRNTTSIVVTYLNIVTESGANPNTLLVSVFR